MHLINAPFSRERLNRIHHKSYDKSKNIHWTFSQGQMLLLKITQKTNHVTISLVRFNIGQEKQTVVSVWNLPFKLDVLKIYLMQKDLSEDDRKVLFLTLRPSKILMHQIFSELMYSRINNIVEALKQSTVLDNPKLVVTTSPVIPGTTFDPSIFLNSKSFIDHNSFIEDVIEKEVKSLTVTSIA